MRYRLATVFGIDPRGLAAFRIGLGTLLLIDLGIRATDLVGHYTDAGVLPRALLVESWSHTWRWSLHVLGGSAASQALLFLFAALAAVAVLVGYRTRWAVIISWVLLVSLHARNPLLLNGGDVLLRLLLCWSIFLPLNSWWAIDCRRQVARDRSPVISLASAAILLQVCLMYVMTAYFKYRGGWVDAEAFQQVLRFETYAKPCAYWLLSFPRILPWLGYAVLALELMGPILVLSPFATRTLRFMLIPCFFLLHLGIEVSLTVGLFGLVSMLAWVLFLPPDFWDIVCRTKGNPEQRENVSHLPPEGNFRIEQRDDPLSRVPASGSSAVQRWVTVGRRAVVAIAFLCVLIWNATTVSRAWRHALRKPPLRRLDDLFVFRQKWNMFAGPTRHGWFVVVARLQDGRVVDLMRDGQPADWNSYEKPKYIYRRYPNHRWRKFYRNLSRGSGSRCYGPLCRFLADQWDHSHPKSAAVGEIELHYMEIMTGQDEEQDRFMQRLLYHEVLER